MSSRSLLPSASLSLVLHPLCLRARTSINGIRQITEEQQLHISTLESTGQSMNTPISDFNNMLPLKLVSLRGQTKSY